MLAEELENSIVRGKCRINRQSANQRGRPASHRCGLCPKHGVLGQNPLWKSGRQFARNIVVLFPQRSWEPLPAQLALCGLSFSCGATSERRLSPETFLRKPSLGATTRMPFRQPPELGKGPICPSCVATAPWRGIHFRELAAFPTFSHSAKTRLISFSIQSLLTSSRKPTSTLPPQ